MRNILLTLWQLPQILIGWVLLLFYRPSSHKDYWAGVRVYLSPKMRGGISLGSVVILGENPSDKTLVHELGHCIQSRRLGWLYLIVIGLPSILWAATHKWLAPNKSYYWFYTEKWADKIAGIDR
jgi:hypothetical protein